jgi:ABC-type bacteriocin/lantibiotic exporter with double-glycine peptidase domain
MVLFKTLIAAGLLTVGAYLVIRNEITVGQFVASEIVIILVMGSVEKIILILETMFDLLTGVEKLAAITDMPLEQPGGRPLMTVADCKDRHPGMGIEARDLSYRYTETGRVALRGVSFNVKPGERIGIAGHPGSGKTALLNVLSGLLSEYKGNLLVDDVAMRQIDLDELRHQIGDHTAGEDVFRGTLLENIAMGKDGIDLAAVDDAVRRTGLESLVQDLPKGLHTELEPTGRGLSSSIVARIILARSIVDQPRLLAIEGLFGPFTPFERQHVLDLLTGEDRTWTLFMVTKDPQVAIRCDRILVLEDGELIANGTPNEILAQEAFRDLFYDNPT